MVEIIRRRLFELQDLGYKEFHCRLMPGVEPDMVIGVRTPLLRAFAKELAKDGRVVEFLNDLPHRYYDERNLHGFIISETKDYDECIGQVERFLPIVDNWATCDLLSPKAFKKKGCRSRLVVDIPGPCPGGRGPPEKPSYGFNRAFAKSFAENASSQASLSLSGAQLIARDLSGFA